MALSTRSGRIDPPFLSPVTASDTGTTTQPWSEYHQSVEDRLVQLQSTIGKGVTDGSNAAAGSVGEYMTASASGVALSTGATVNIVSLNLTAGDWDATGEVTFTTGAGAHPLILAVGLQALDTQNSPTFPTGAFTHSMWTGPKRISLTGTTAVWLVALGSFSGGTLTAQGTVRARRMR
jgi:hypothetical protein